MTDILVTGATGTLGRALVPRLAASGHRLRILSRHPRPTPATDGLPLGTGPALSSASVPAPAWVTGDLRRGEGLAKAVAGTQVIVHCASAPRGDPAAARNLIAAARQAESPHLVYISIVGVDRIPFGYYRAKLACEELIAASGLPWTVLRATQFHDLILRICTMLARPPVMLVPTGFSFQPVDVADVAGRLADLAGGGPGGRVPDMGGPQVRTASELAWACLQASGRHRPLLPVWVPGAAAAAFRRGGNLAPGAAAGQVTFSEFLAARPGRREQR
jgi:uncharacterized protein YbjT (DUF2867 family)